MKSSEGVSAMKYIPIFLLEDILALLQTFETYSSHFIPQ